MTSLDYEPLRLIRPLIRIWGAVNDRRILSAFRPTVNTRLTIFGGDAIALHEGGLLAERHYLILTMRT